MFRTLPIHERQKKGSLMCAKLAANSLLQVPIDDDDVLAYASFRSSCWSVGKSQCVVEPTFFCKNMTAAVKWDFFLEYLSNARNVLATKIDGISWNSPNNGTILQKSFSPEPLLALLKHPKVGRTPEYYHVVAVRDSIVYDCDLKQPTSLIEYDQIALAEKIYVLRAKVR
jgi:hypothetical protein